MAQTVTIRLSDLAINYLKRVAELTKQPVDEIIEQSLTHSLPPLIDDIPSELQSDVFPLLQMSDSDLQKELRRVFPTTRWDLYEKLLDKKKSTFLSDKEQGQLDNLRREADVLMFRKGYAAVLLKRHGYRIPSASELPLPA